MPVDVEDVVRLLAMLADDANLRVSVKESVKGGAIAMATTTMGGILMGPVGLAVGGAVGGAMAAYRSWGKFRPVGDVLRQMSKDQKLALVDQVKDIVDNLGVEDVLAIYQLASGNFVLQKQLLDHVTDHITSNMQMQIVP